MKRGITRALVIMLACALFVSSTTVSFAAAYAEESVGLAQNGDVAGNEASTDGGNTGVSDDEADDSSAVDSEGIQAGSSSDTNDDSIWSEGEESLPSAPSDLEEGQGDVVSDNGDDQLASLSIYAHVSGKGWLAPVDLGDVAGTEGEERALEALRIDLPEQFDGGLEIRAHVAEIGWQDWISMSNNGAFAGTTGESLSSQAFEIRLTGSVAEQYDIWYSVHMADFGWSGWAKNGEPAGSQGYGKQAEAIKVVLTLKGSEAPGDTSDAFRMPLIAYSAHIARYGWRDRVYDGDVAGTTGRSLRLEALKVSLGEGAGSGEIQVRAHVQNVGWQDWTSGTAGTTGQSNAIEAIEIRLTGDVEDKYDVWYRVHSAHFGWLGWTSNGSPAGSQGYGYQLEAIQICLLPKNSSAPGDTSSAFEGPSVSWQSHVHNMGWLKMDGASGLEPAFTIGTTGNGLPLEAFELFPVNMGVDGSISYSAHISQIGWQDTVSDGAIAGTTGRNLAIEAVRISLTGGLADKYDIWYRVHVANLGWLDWAKNGDAAGSEGISMSVEAVEVRFKLKGSQAPGNSSVSFIEAPDLLYCTRTKAGSWQAPVGLNKVSGSVGAGINIDGLTIAYDESSLISGAIEYRVHAANAGWLGWTSGGSETGSSGNQIEAIEIKLTGDISKYCDVYYRVHTDRLGWLGWAKNGMTAGTTGCSLGVQAVQIAVVYKNGPAPGSTSGSHYLGMDSLPYMGYQTPGNYYKVSNRSVSIKNLGVNQFGYRTESRIPWDASREQCINAMITRAIEYTGTPYRWDYSCAPGVGVDCAGLVMQGLYATGMDLSPMNPWDHYYTPGHDHYANDMRASSRFMHVSASQRRRGDLICYSGHIAIYMGNDQIIEAVTPRVRTHRWNYLPVLAVLRPFP